MAGVAPSDHACTTIEVRDCNRGDHMSQSFSQALHDELLLKILQHIPLSGRLATMSLTCVH